MLNSNEFQYPALLRVSGKRCVIIGGGTVAYRKLATLCQAGALVTVVAPAFCPQLEAAAQQYGCQLLRDSYRPQYLQQAFVVIAATDNKDVNRAITADAPFLVNNITEPELSNFIVPASFTSGGITVALSTGGMPAFTRLLRERLEKTLGSAELGDFNSFLLEQRELVQATASTPEQRTAFWRQVLSKELLNLVIAGQSADAKEKVSDAVNSFRTQSQNSSR